MLTLFPALTMLSPNDFHIYLARMMAIPGSSTLSTLFSDSILHSPNRVPRHFFHRIPLFLCNGLDLFSKWLVLDRLSVEHDASHLGAADDEEEEVHGSQEDVPRLNDEAPSGPDGACGHESGILSQREGFSRTSEIGDTSEDETPLHDRSPEMHGLWPYGAIP